MKLICIWVVLGLFSLTSNADQLLEQKTISRIFAEGATQAGFYTSEGLPQCKWGIMFINLSNESGKAHFTMALAAKMAGQKVIRMDYTVSAEKCSITGMHIQ